MIRIGFDVGGSKIAALALDRAGREVGRRRQDVPRDYASTLAALARLATELMAGHGPAEAIGVALPGMIGAVGEPLRVVNLPWVEGRPLRADLAQALAVPVAVANDANCFALSEAVDGAAAGAAVVFGVILGTGVGGGIVVERKPLAGANAIAGEWGHNPLPPCAGADGPPATCGCGRTGCIESWLNGAALARDHARLTGRVADGPAIARRAEAGDAAALATLDRYRQRLADRARRNDQHPRSRGDRARWRPVGAARPVRRGARLGGGWSWRPTPARASSPPASAPRAACAAPPGSAGSASEVGG